MAKIYRLIDGYNLMHAAGMARQKYGPGDLERCRNQFIHWLISQLTPQERRLTTLVFDAEAAEKSWIRKLHQENLTIQYAPAGSDADTLLEELITEHNSPKQIHLISSDHRLHKAARRRKARAIDSEDFIKWLADREIHLPRQREQKPGHPPSEAELKEWLELFGEIPEAERLPQKTSHPKKSKPAPPDKIQTPPRHQDWIQRLQDEIDNM